MKHDTDQPPRGQHFMVVHWSHVAGLPRPRLVTVPNSLVYGHSRAEADKIAARIDARLQPFVTVAPAQELTAATESLP